MVPRNWTGESIFGEVRAAISFEKLSVATTVIKGKGTNFEGEYTISGSVESDNVKFQLINSGNKDSYMTYTGKINSDLNEI